MHCVFFFKQLNQQVMLYFSAHWCPPCRRFTPVLIELYNKLKESSSSMELVFVSLDSNEKEFQEYSSNMPWLCTVFDEESNGSIAQKYKANGIPHLVVLDGSDNGAIITMNGTSEVQTDKSGVNFPWKPKPFSEIFPKEFLSTKDEDGAYEMIPTSSIQDKYLMLYFSAHWCPPCRAFTPKLSEAYTSLKKSEKADDFELIFISSDKDDSSFQEYFDTMTFCALPFEYREAKAQLGKLFDVSGIPQLIMLGPQDKNTGDRPVINDDVRGIVQNCIDNNTNIADEFPFVKKNYGDLGMNAGDLYDKKHLIVFHENGDDDEQQEVMNNLKELANRSTDDDNIGFLWSFDTDGVAPRIRQLIKKPVSEHPTIVILDIPDNGGYYICSQSDISVESLLDFQKNPGERQQLE